MLWSKLIDNLYRLTVSHLTGRNNNMFIQMKSAEKLSCQKLTNFLQQIRLKPLEWGVKILKLMRFVTFGRAIENYRGIIFVYCQNDEARSPFHQEFMMSRSKFCKNLSQY